jgi:hypothetical protein
MLRAIHAQESRAAADRKARAIVDDLRAAKMNTAADLVERSVSETLTYYAFPDIHWQKIRITDEIDKNFFLRARRLCGDRPQVHSFVQPCWGRSSVPAIDLAAAVVTDGRIRLGLHVRTRRRGGKPESSTDTGNAAGAASREGPVRT